MFRPELISFLKLLGRKPDLGEGWKEYSDDEQRLVFKMYKSFPGLFDTIIGENNILKIRTTDECNTLVKWMNYVPPKLFVEKDEEDDASE